ncbi:MAG: Rrf2 family transcriptional regulator [Polyangiales bacterium]
MKRDSRLSVALHVLVHMHDMRDAISSETLGAMMGQNPAVLRRTMGGLRDAGIVHSDKGHGGGWKLARPLSEVTLGEVYAALGTPALFSIGHREESPGCLVEQAVNRALGRALDEAEALLLARLRSVTIADIAAEVLQHEGFRLGHHGPGHKPHKKGTKHHA